MTTKTNIFEFSSYKAYLKEVETARSISQRGFRSRLAERLSCQNAYISQILNGQAHLSLEQAIEVGRFLRLEKGETTFFLRLVEFERAGSHTLRTHLAAELEELRETYLTLRRRVGEFTELSSDAQATYYSHWYYAVIHVLVTIPRFSQPAAIAEVVKLPRTVIDEAIEFLAHWRLIEQTESGLRPGPTLLHLGKDSVHISKHHTNFRLLAIQSLAAQDSSDLHYSTVSSLSMQDIEVLRTRLADVVQNYVATVRDSKEEALCAFNLDFFTLVAAKN